MTSATAGRCPWSGRTSGWTACTGPPRPPRLCARWTSPRARSPSTPRLTRRTSDQGRGSPGTPRPPHTMRRKLRFGMIGGGRGAFIGGVHRIAAAMDGKAELVAGAFSSDAERSRASGEDLFLDPSRVYGSYGEMAKAEASMPTGKRLDFVVIVTPNHQHFGPARLFLESGLDR